MLKRCAAVRAKRGGVAFRRYRVRRAAIYLAAGAYVLRKCELAAAEQRESALVAGFAKRGMRDAMGFSAAVFFAAGCAARPAKFLAFRFVPY
jgi:HJR/Mrr/RecB family endonuclease